VILILRPRKFLKWCDQRATARPRSQSYFTTGGLPPISSSWRQAPWDSRSAFFFQLNVCGHSPYVTSLKRGWVGSLQLLLALASEVISQTRVPRDSWPYFTVCFEYLPNTSGRTEERTFSVTPKIQRRRTFLGNSGKHVFAIACIFVAAETCLLSRCLSTAVSSGTTIPNFMR
jgi:hypothetical protein